MLVLVCAAALAAALVLGKIVAQVLSQRLEGDSQVTVKIVVLLFAQLYHYKFHTSSFVYQHWSQPDNSNVALVIVMVALAAGYQYLPELSSPQDLIGSIQWVSLVGVYLFAYLQPYWPLQFLY